MTDKSFPPDLRRAFFRALVLDGLCVAGGIAGFVLTQNWVWLVGGVLLGSGFLLPALVRIMRSRR